MLQEYAMADRQKREAEKRKTKAKGQERNTADVSEQQIYSVRVFIGNVTVPKCKRIFIGIGVNVW